MSDGDEMGAGPRAAQDRQYETKVVQAIRGTESRAEAKWRKEGWELVSQSPGTLRTEMTFQRTKPKTFWSYVGQGYTTFRGLQPRTQQVLGGVLGGLLLVLVSLGVVLATRDGDDPPATAATPTEAATPSQTPAGPTPSPTVEPSSEEPTSGDEPTQAAREDKPSEQSAAEPEVVVPEPYTYAGPQYEIVTVDEGAVLGELDQYWVLTDKLDYADPQYKDKVRAIVTDVAREAGTDALDVEVVSDEEIIEAESADTIGPFMDRHGGTDYFAEVVAPKEKSDWIASYLGGARMTDEGLRVSDAPEAFEIVWLPASDSPDFEMWKPQTPSP